MASVTFASQVGVLGFFDAAVCELKLVCPASRNCPLFGAAIVSDMLSHSRRGGGLKSFRVEASFDADGGSAFLANHKGKLASLVALEQLKSTAADRYTREKSSILVLGLTVHTAPVEMREKLAVPEAEWSRAIGDLCNLPHVEEAAVLSTCNRMEIYVVALSWHRGVKEVTEWMSRTSGIPLVDLHEHLFILRDRDATQHLFRVASGLDSLVLGEGQILSQVKQVYKVGQGANGFGRNLTGLFKQAITAGKRVRTETSIAAGAVSVSSAAVELAAVKLPVSGFTHVRVLIVGAGKMARLLVKHLISKGCTRMSIANRTVQRVSELQAEFPDAELLFRPFDQMMQCAGEADLIFASTAAEAPLFHKETVECLPLAGEHVGYIRHFIDISVPRNVSACVAEVASARVFNVDHLKEVVRANKDERQRKALEAQVVIQEELRSFEAWRDSLETVPTIKRLRAYAESVRLAELEKCLSKMGEDLSNKHRKLVEEMSRGIVNKLLHGPMTHLRCDESSGRTVNETLENMQALERMFNLKLDALSLEKQLRARTEMSEQ